MGGLQSLVIPAGQLNYQPLDSGRIYIFILGSYTSLSLIDAEDNILYSMELNPIEQSYHRLNLSYFFYKARNEIEKGVPYRLSATRGSSTDFSNILIFEDVDDFSIIQYRCYEDALGFPFSTSYYAGNASMLIPIRLHSPQNVQEDKTYVKANGEVVTLFAKYYKEWEGETEYLSEKMHNKIVAALSCDVVYINDKRVTKSDKYQIDWENYDIDCDGVTKLARATFKVRENITQRNSNF